MERSLKNPRVRKKLDMDCPDDVVEKQTLLTGSLITEVVDEGNYSKRITDSRHRSQSYNLRDCSRKTYHSSDVDDAKEDFSPDVSEYIPSPDYLKNRRLSSSSSLGGDSQYIEAIQSKISRTPSTISNLSLLLNPNVDFVASPNVVYLANCNTDTPTSTIRSSVQNQCQDKVDAQENLSTSFAKYDNGIQIIDISLKPSGGLVNNIPSCEYIVESETNSSASTPSMNSHASTHIISTVAIIHASSCSSDLADSLQGQSSSVLHNKIAEITEEQDLQVTNLDDTLQPNQSYTTSDITLIIEKCSDYSPRSAGSHNDELNDSPSICTGFCTESTNEDKTTGTNNNLKESHNEVIEKSVNQGEGGRMKINTNNETIESDKNDYCRNDNRVNVNTENIEIYHSLSENRIEESSFSQNNINKTHSISDVNQKSTVTENTSDCEVAKINQLTDDDINSITEHDNSNSIEILNTTEEPPVAKALKKLTRKRPRDEDNWQCNLSKKLKNSGKAYKGYHSKKEYPEKRMRATCSCKKKCGEHFSPRERQDIFDKFYGLGDHELQWHYIVRYTEADDIKRMTMNRKNNRTQSIKYFFPKNERKYQVCKVFFINTLRISDTMIYTALEKVKTNENLIDKRGNHENRPRKMNTSTEKSIINHINLFPKVESHYVRKCSSRFYLSENLNIAKMYRLYTKWFSHQNYTEDVKIATARQYRTIFNTKFNFSFFRPKKDLCAMCSRYEQADQELKSSLAETYQRHISNKEKAREIKNEEKKNVDISNTTIAIFDLEKVLYIPRSEVGIFYYKRKYPVYNFTIFDASRKIGHCFMWHLQIAKRGSIEIGSCLLQFLTAEYQRGIKNISFYSDGCAGQNKNRFIFALHLYAVSKFEMTITHRFFETGHSQNEGDSMHSCIERELKNKVIYTPDQIYAVVMNAKVSGEQYQVKEMNQSNFYDIKKLVEGKNWLRDTNGNKISWSKVMEVCASHTHPEKILFKYNLSEEYLELNTRIAQTQTRRKRGGKTTQATTSEVTDVLQCAYSQPIPVPKPLYSDLMYLCKNDAIPHHYHGFYESLIHQGDGDQSQSPNEDDSEEE